MQNRAEGGESGSSPIEHMRGVAMRTAFAERLVEVLQRLGLPARVVMALQRLK